jgi:ribosomal-protein-alanine N-acetyltransferase
MNETLRNPFLVHNSAGAPRIRLMAARDLNAVLEIERLSFSVPWSRASFERELNENRSVARYLVIERGRRVLGYAGMWLVVDEGHITNVAIHPDARGKGDGERLMRALMDMARELGLNYMTLEVRRSNNAAQCLYRKLGFVDVGYRKRYYEDNQEDALIMVWEGV